MSHEHTDPHHSERQLGQTHQEIVQYNDGQLAIKISGHQGDGIDFSKHKWGPDKLDGEAIVLTESGNGYYVWTNEDHTLVVNAGETKRQGHLVAAENKHYPVHFPPIEFEKSWHIPGFYDTSPVKSVLMKYKWAHPNSKVGKQVDLPDTDTPNPFVQMKKLAYEHGYSYRREPF